MILTLFYLCGLVISSHALEPIKLSEPRLNRGKLLMKALKERKSARSFDSKALPLEVLSDLLWAAGGINRPGSAKRTAPSAGNMQEIDIYVATQEGLYLYKPSGHLLEGVLEKDIREFTGKQDFTQAAPVNLIYVADLSRMGRYDESADFYSATDTAFISQNAYLFCASEGLATVILGFVDKDKLAKIMKLNEHQKVILTQPVGYGK